MVGVFWTVLLFFLFFLIWVGSRLWLVCAWCAGRTLITLVWWIWLDLMLLMVGVFWSFFDFFLRSDQELGLIGVCLMRWKNVDTVGLVESIGFDIVDSRGVWLLFFLFFFDLIWFHFISFELYWELDLAYVWLVCWKNLDYVGLVDVIGFDIIDGRGFNFYFSFSFLIWFYFISFELYWELGLAYVWLVCWKNIDTVGLVELVGFDIVNGHRAWFFFSFFLFFLIWFDWVGLDLGCVWWLCVW